MGKLGGPRATPGAGLWLSTHWGRHCPCCWLCPCWGWASQAPGTLLLGLLSQDLLQSGTGPSVWGVSEAKQRKACVDIAPLPLASSASPQPLCPTMPQPYPLPHPGNPMDYLNSIGGPLAFKAAPSLLGHAKFGWHPCLVVPCWRGVGRCPPWLSGVSLKGPQLLRLPLVTVDFPLQGVQWGHLLCRTQPGDLWKPPRSLLQHQSPAQEASAQASRSLEEQADCEGCSGPLGSGDAKLP